jgi:hypothetical protein
LQLLGHLQDGRDRGGDVRPVVDVRPFDDRHYCSSEKRTGSPPMG